MSDPDSSGRADPTEQSVIRTSWSFRWLTGTDLALLQFGRTQIKDCGDYFIVLQARGEVSNSKRASSSHTAAEIGGGWVRPS